MKSTGRIARNTPAPRRPLAYLSGTDPTGGAIHLYQAGTPTRSNLKFANGDPQGVPLSTQSGPCNNSYTKGQVSSGTAWLNTYHEK